MLLSNMKMTLKTILRDSTTAFAVLIAVIMNFMYGLGDYARVDQLDVHSAPGVTQTFNYAMNVMLEIFSKPVSEIAFPFLGVIIAVNLFKELRSNTYDIMEVGQTSFGRFYFGKVISYYLVGLVMSLALGLSFEILYLIVYHPFHWELNWLGMLASQLAWMLALYTSCLLIPIALGVFAASVTGVSVAASIVNCAYYYLPMMTPIRKYNFYNYIHVTPMKLLIFMKYWIVEPDDWYKVRYGDDFAASFGFDSSLKDALISYFSMILLAAVLLTASYFLLKRRYEKA